MSGQKKGRDLSQFNYGNMSSLVVNQGEPRLRLRVDISADRKQIVRSCDKMSLPVFPNRSSVG